MSTTLPSCLNASVDFAGLSPYHLSAEQIRSFDERGFLILRKWIDGELLERLQAAGHRWIAQAQSIENPAAAPLVPEELRADYQFASREVGRVPFRVDYLHSKLEPASLELLGCPRVLAVAESLCGHNFVPTYESMVFKMPGDGEKIHWHQDAVFPRKYRVFNFDLYLDHSRKEGGALRVIPGSQRRTQNICQLAEAHGWDPPGMITVEMEPGDVLLHDDMVVHGSPRAEGAELRRTIYFEFRPVEQILDEGPWDRDWIERRMRLLPVALKRYQDAAPGQPQFAWNADAEFRPAATGDEAVELKVVHVLHTTGSYCSAGSAVNPETGAQWRKD